MTADLIDLLTEAGEAIDGAGRRAVALRVDEGVEVAALDLTVDGTGRRGGRGLWLTAAAVLIVLLVALAAIPRGDDPPPATPTTLGAFVPAGGLGQWTLDEVHESSRPVDPPGSIWGDSLVVVPDGSDELTRRVQISRNTSGGGLGPFREVDGSGLAGRLVTMTDGAHALHIPGTPGAERLTLTSSGEIGVDQLFELAAQFDVGRPVAEQDPGLGWRVVARSSDNAHTVVRSLSLSRPVADGHEQVHIATVVDATESTMWFFRSAHASEVEVRGTAGWAWDDGGRASLSWMEAPDLMVLVSARVVGPRPGEADPMVVAQSLAEGLMAIPLDQWTDLLERTRDERRRSFDSGDGEASVEPAQAQGEARAGTWRLYFDEAEGGVCRVIPADAEPECDGPDRALGEPGASIPWRALSFEGEPELVYGLLPPEAVSAVVTWEMHPAENDDGGPERVEDEAEMAGPIWYITPPSNLTLLRITYYDARGDELESYDFD